MVGGQPFRCDAVEPGPIPMSLEISTPCCSPPRAQVKKESGATFCRDRFRLYGPFGIVEGWIETDLSPRGLLARPERKRSHDSKIPQIGTGMMRIHQAIFSENGDPGFPMKVFRTCYAELEGYSQSELPHLTEDQRAWAFAYVAQGSTGVLNCWVAGGMRQPTDEVATFVAGLTTAALQSLRWGGRRLVRPLSEAHYLLQQEFLIDIFPLRPKLGDPCSRI